MRKHEMEKKQLTERMQEQSQTIHQLTHHVHLLQSAQNSHSHRQVEVDVSEGVFGGKYPLFFRRSNGDGSIASSHARTTEPWPLSDHVDQKHSLNISQLSDLHASGLSYKAPNADFVDDKVKKTSEHKVDKSISRTSTPSKGAREHRARIDTER